MGCELARRESGRPLAAHLDHVVIDSTPPRRWSLIREPWQSVLVRPLVPAIEHACGFRPGYAGPLFFWLTLPKGQTRLKAGVPGKSHGQFTSRQCPSASIADKSTGPLH